MSNTSKFFVPKNIPTGVVAIQCEAIIDLSKMTENPERARQAVNGLINSRYLDDKVNQLLTLVCYRYYIDDTVSPAAKINTLVDYRDMVTKGFSQVRSQLDGHYMFTPAQVWTLDELRALPENFTESDRIQTNSVLTLIDGWVAYDEHGVCLGAIKFPGAGRDRGVPTGCRGHGLCVQGPEGLGGRQCHPAGGGDGSVQKSDCPNAWRE